MSIYQAIYRFNQDVIRVAISVVILMSKTSTFLAIISRPRDCNPFTKDIALVIFGKCVGFL